jgi:hypothetical protein
MEIYALWPGERLSGHVALALCLLTLAKAFGPVKLLISDWSAVQLFWGRKYLGFFLGRFPKI